MSRPKEHLRNKLVAVDLFAGAGGLSLGARWAGFDVKVAVELDPDAAATYRANHRNAVVIQSDIREVTGADILKNIPSGSIDLLMGCAPCQEYCSLTKRDYVIDAEASLVLEMARLMEEIRPAAVLMENVPGLAIRGSEHLNAFMRRLELAGYLAEYWAVQMADYGIPQNRRRLVLLAGRGFRIDLPRPTHTSKPEKDLGLLPWRTLRTAIYGNPPPMRLDAVRGMREIEAAGWHVVRNLGAATRSRLRAATPGGMRFELDPRLLPACHQAGYRGFRNVYMRMSWDKVAPTITAGCTTPAKGRFGHPDRRRTTISVREAATIQTFPARYQLKTDKIDAACSLVGNAVPPVFARQIATQVRSGLDEHYASVER